MFGKIARFEFRYQLGTRCSGSATILFFLLTLRR